MINLLYGFVFLYLLACIGLWAQQRRLLYFPTPAATDLPAAQTVLENVGEKLRIWQLTHGTDHPANHQADHQPQETDNPSPAHSELAILYFGGNGEAVELNIPEFQHHLVDSQPQADVYLMNYRGYGGSSGKPTEQGLYSDALALYDHIRERHQRIAVIGRSLGSGVATYVAAHREVDKLVLITAYDSIMAIAAERFTVFPVRFLMQDKYLSANRAPSIKAPTLLLTAEDDTIIPGKHTAALKAAFPATQVQEKVFLDRHHNDIQADPDYYGAVVDFLAS